MVGVSGWLVRVMIMMVGLVCLWMFRGDYLWRVDGFGFLNFFFEINGKSEFFLFRRRVRIRF